MSIVQRPATHQARRDDWDMLYISLVPLPAFFLLATLVSDCLYWVTAGTFWSNLSEWLLGGGLASGAIAAADGLIRYLSAGCIRPSRACWLHVSGNVLALLLSLSNLVYRWNEDSGRAVIPAGITLTAVVFCLLIFTARLGGDVPAEIAEDEGDDREIFEDEAPAELPAVPELKPEAPVRPRPTKGSRRNRASRKDRSDRDREPRTAPVA
jgi:uncharacterized membrane protein